MSLRPSIIPRGCFKEIRNYHKCATAKGAANCFADKISIMEVCPDHVLEGLREKKKWTLRAELIDNDTYKRAMQVSDFNLGRSVTELQLKTWDFGKSCNMRSDSLYQDDRYNPTKYSHPHRFDNVNFPEQEYKDFFGGTMGEGEKADYEHNQLSFTDGTSDAMHAHQAQKRKSKLNQAKDAVNAANSHWDD